MLRDARERYALPVVEVISPAARRAAAATRNGRVGVICTEATATSQAYDDAFAAAPSITLSTVACPRFVPFVEAGITATLGSTYTQLVVFSVIILALTLRPDGLLGRAAVNKV